MHDYPDVGNRVKCLTKSREDQEEREDGRTDGRWCNSHTSSRRLIVICRYCNHKTESSVLQNKAECIFGDSELQNNAAHYELTFLAIWGEKISTVLQEDCVSVGELKTNASLPFHQILLHTRKRKRNTNVVGIDNIHCWL